MRTVLNLQSYNNFYNFKIFNVQSGLMLTLLLKKNFVGLRINQ